MRKLFWLAAFLLMGGTAWAQLSPEEIANGVTCGINDVHVIAKNADDCTKAGGAVVHHE